jgi:hypothetical protein
MKAAASARNAGMAWGYPRTADAVVALIEETFCADTNPTDPGSSMSWEYQNVRYFFSQF